ncbi:MAG: M17 family peptidase N-terminal domain-containing protein, partial [Gemmatimonadales bacterium]
MKSTISATPLAQVETPLLAVAVPQGPLPPSLADLDRASGGVLARASGAGDFKGKRDESLLLYGTGNTPRILLVGVGKAAEITRTAL